MIILNIFTKMLIFFLFLELLKQSNIGENLFGRASQESLDGARKRRPSFGLSSKTLTNATRIINQHLFGLPLISNKTGTVIYFKV
jgi:hypothetical protein